MISFYALFFLCTKTLIITTTGHLSILIKPEEDIELILACENTTVLFSYLANLQILVYHPSSTLSVHKVITNDMHIVGFHSTIRNIRLKISTTIDSNFIFDVIVHKNDCNQIFVSNRKHEILIIDSVNSNVTDSINQNVCFWYGSMDKHSVLIDINILSTDTPFLILTGTSFKNKTHITLPKTDKYIFKGPTMFVWSKSSLPIPRFLSITIDQASHKKIGYEYSSNIKINEDILYFYNDLYTKQREIKRRRVKGDNQIEFAFRPPPTPTSPIKDLMRQVKIPTMVFLLAISIACFYAAFAVRKPQTKLKRKGIFSKKNIFSNIENTMEGASLFSDFEM